MRFFVRCDQEGNITSTMKVDAMDDALDHPYGPVDEGHLVLELKMPKGAEEIEPHDFSGLYRVDVKEKKLRKLKAAPANRPAKKGRQKIAQKSRRKART